MAELKTLMEEEIPEGRDALLESHQNLQKVSAYCTQKYLEDPDKKKSSGRDKKLYHAIACICSIPDQHFSQQYAEHA